MLDETRLAHEGSIYFEIVSGYIANCGRYTFILIQNTFYRFFCLKPKIEQGSLMQTIDITTTQNVTIEYELATLRDRFLALLIDVMVVGTVYFILFITITVSYTHLTLPTTPYV